MATGTKSLPTDSPVPYCHPYERGPMSEGRLSDVDPQEFTRSRYVPPQQVNPWEATELPGGIGYHPFVSGMDNVSTYTGLDDYDTLFEARHGRGALDQVPRKNEEVTITSSVGVTPSISGAGLIVTPMGELTATVDIGPTRYRESVPKTTNPLGHRVVSPGAEIIGEDAAIFTDMTETILSALDQQMVMSSDVQKPEGMLIGTDMTRG